MLCQLCQSDAAQNFHHFIPRTLHSNKWFKRRFSRERMAEGIEVCKSCHKAIHDLMPDKKELGRRYNSREKLLSQPELNKYVAWKRSRRAPRGRSGPGLRPDG